MAYLESRTFYSLEAASFEVEEEEESPLALPLLQPLRSKLLSKQKDGEKAFDVRNVSASTTTKRNEQTNVDQQIAE